MDDLTYEAEYLRGIEHFNAREFFEAHDAWEVVWVRSTSPDRLFYKGLIHAAVALHHLGNGNLTGARKIARSCLRYLTPYAPRHLGLEVEAFLADLQVCFAELLDPARRATHAPLDPRRIPVIPLNAPLVIPRVVGLKDSDHPTAADRRER